MRLKPLELPFSWDTEFTLPIGYTKLDIRIPWRIKKFLNDYCGIKQSSPKTRFIPDFSTNSLSELTTFSVGNKKTAGLRLPRENTLFLADLDQFRLLTEGKYRGRPKESVIEVAEGLCSDSFPVYSENLPPLNIDFDWSITEKLRPDDLLYRVRPHRFGFAPILSLAGLYQGRYLEKLDQLISKWMRFVSDAKTMTPYTSNLVVTYRLVALTWSWYLVAANNHEITAHHRLSLLTNMLTIIREDIRFLEPGLGQSHPNNHLLADYFIGWFSAFYYPEFVSKDAFSHFESLWLSELKRQFYSDGGNFEHSLHYHELGCEMASIYLMSKRASGQAIDQEVQTLIAKMVALQINLSGREGRQWTIGDTTEDPLFPLISQTGGRGLVWEEIYRRYFQDGDKQIEDCEIKGFEFWLIAAMPHNSGEFRKTVDKVEMNHYPLAGFNNFYDSTLNSSVLFRTGVAPESSYMPGHMHSDILSLYWRCNGLDILAASGTYSYRSTNKKNINFREFFCSRVAHSGFVILGEDPLGAMIGDFRDIDNGARVRSKDWLNREVASCCEGEFCSANDYDGYKRGVINIPGLFTFVYDIVPDSIAGFKKGFGWQFTAETELKSSSNNELLINIGKTRASIVPASNLGTSTVFRGEKAPPLGWISSQYGSIQPAPYCYFPFNESAGLTGFLLLSQTAGNVRFVLDMLGSSTIWAKVQLNGMDHDVILSCDGTPIHDLPGLPDFTGCFLHIVSDQGILRSAGGIAVSKLKWTKYDIDIDSNNINDVIITSVKNKYKVRFLP